MMKPTARAARLGAIAGLVLVFGACSLLAPGTPPKTRLYMLSPLAPAGQTAEAPARLAQLAIGIGPVRIPEYLDRRNLVVRSQQNEYEIVELSQWAEPLADTLGRVLADNLSLLLGTRRMVQFPWRPTIPVDYQLAVQVTQFDGRFEDQVVLRAYWQVFAGQGQQLLDFGYAVIEEKIGEPTVEALVAAKSRAAGRFSREIAAAVTMLAR
jgi:uncharacterized lipoprotein YmbA